MVKIFLKRNGLTAEVNQLQLDCLRAMLTDFGDYLKVFEIWERYQAFTKAENRADEGRTTQREIQNWLDDLARKKVIDKNHRDFRLSTHYRILDIQDTQ
jgi:hypothetical protein